MVSLLLKDWVPSFGKHYYSIHDNIFSHMSNRFGTIFRRRKTSFMHRFCLTLGLSRSLVDSYLDCRAHEITLPTHNRKFFWLQHPRCAGGHCCWEWVAQPRTTEIGSCTFSCEDFAPVALESSSLVARTIFFRSICHKLHTSFICLCSRLTWSWVIVYAYSATTKKISITRNCITVHCELITNFTQSTVDLCGTFAA